MPATIVLPPGPSALEQLAQRIDDVSSLPQVALRVVEVANDPESTAADLKAVMEIDVSLSARVLRCVNSSAYALRTKITNLQQAIAYLGMKQIRNLAMTASVSRLFKQEDQIGPYRRSGLWRHLLATGICGRLIAMRLKFREFEDVFLAGLLHDIGLILEDQYAHREFVGVIQALGSGRPLAEIERQHLGFDHTALGERVAASWGFPEVLRAAIRHHHALVVYQGEHLDLLRCVDVANLICSFRGMPSVGIPLVKATQASIAGLGLGKQDLLVLAEDLDREIERNSSLFQEA